MLHKSVATTNKREGVKLESKDFVLISTKNKVVIALCYMWHRKSLMGKMRQPTVDPQQRALVRKNQPRRTAETWTFYEKGVHVT